MTSSDSRFWNALFRNRRCLVPMTFISEPKVKRPAIWHWFALGKDRQPFAFAGIWRSYTGPVKKDSDPVEIDVFAFLTTKPNDLVATVHPTRMPVMLVGEDAQSAWLDGSPDAARDLLRPYPAKEMSIVKRGTERSDRVE